MKKLSLLLVAMLLIVPAIVSAQERPAGNEANKVINYYFDGQGNGAVLMESKLCKEIAKEGDNKNEAVDEITNGTVALGEKAFLWIKFLVPAGDNAKVLISFSRDGKVRKMTETDVAGSLRWRTWKLIPTDTAGNWKVEMLQEIDGKDIPLGTVEYTVTE